MKDHRWICCKFNTGPELQKQNGLNPVPTFLGQVTGGHLCHVSLPRFYLKQFNEVIPHIPMLVLKSHRDWISYQIIELKAFKFSFELRP